MTTISAEIQENEIQGVSHEIVQNVDVISWKNRDLRRNRRVYLAQSLWLLLALPIAIYLSIQFAREIALFNLAPVNPRDLIFPFFTLVISWLCVLGTVFAWLRVSWSESVEIDDERFSIVHSGFLSPGRRDIPIGDIWRISYERYTHNQDQEYRFSVSVIHKRRERLAHWMRDDDAYELFHLISAILHQRQVADLIKFEENLGPLRG